MPSSQREVVISVPAAADYVHVLRAVTAAAAARLDLPLDDLEDLRLAIDEACAFLLTLDGGPRRLTLTLGGTSQRIEALVVSEGGEETTWPPARLDHSFAWQVLSALSDEVAVERSEGLPAIRIVKGTREGRSS